MSIGGRASEQEQRSSSSSIGQGENINIGNQLAAGKGGSQQTSYGQTGSTNLGQSFSGQDVYGAQAPFLQNLWQQGSGAANAAQSGIGNFLGGEQFSPAVGSAVGNLQGMGDPQALIDAQTASLQHGLQQTFAEGLNSVGANATAAGAFGGDRHAIQEAALGGELADAYTKGYGDIVANARNQAINANNSAIAGAGQGFNMGLQGQLAQLAPMQALAGIVGGPTVLGQSESLTQGGSFGQNFGQGSSFDTRLSQGQNLGYGYNNAQSQSSGRGSNNSAGFGFGLK